MPLLFYVLRVKVNDPCQLLSFMYLCIHTFQNGQNIMQKFIITHKGIFRYGNVRMHKDLLESGDPPCTTKSGIVAVAPWGIIIIL